MAVAYFFDAPYYLRSKTAQLVSARFANPDGSSWLPGKVAEVLTAWAGTGDLAAAARGHYEEFGRAEGLNPNAYFNEYEYLRAKAAQLNSIRHDGKTAWTAADVLNAITAAGMIPAEHYERIGCFETDANGNCVNPSNAFDANAYMAAKLALAQKDDPAAGHTLASIVEAFQANGFSPISHYAAHGASEATAAQTPLAQTVPMSMRVDNDPGRETITGEFLPANYNEPGTVTDSSDVGGKVPWAVSPAPLTDSASPLNPGDAGYVAPPSNVKDTAENPLIAITLIIYGTAETYWLVVDRANNRALMLDLQGTILGWLAVDTVIGDSAAASGRVFPSGFAKPEPVDPDDVPGSVTVRENLDNNFVPDGITARTDGSGNIIIGGSILSADASSVILAADGSIASWAGHADGAVKPDDPLGAENRLDAVSVTGFGVLTLDASACTVANIGIWGAENAKNAIIAGKNTGTIYGGRLADSITVESGGSADYISGGDGGNDITVSGTAGFIAGGYGDDGITVSGTADNIYGDGTHTGFGGADTIIIKSGGTVTGFISGGLGNDTVTVESGGSAGYISGGDGDDTIIVESAATVNGFIAGDDNADTIILRKSGLKLLQHYGDSGVFTVPGGAEETVSTSAFDVVGCSALATIGDTVTFQISNHNSDTAWGGGVSNAVSFSGVSTAENSACLVQGTYNAAGKTFTANDTGVDSLLVYDSDEGGGIYYEAVVIVGVNGGITIETDGALTITVQP